MTEIDGLTQVREWAEADDAFAQALMGVIVSEGRGVPVDRKKGEEWLASASGHGCLWAREYLEKLAVRSSKDVVFSELVGLKSVKEDVLSLRNLVKVQQLRTARGLPNTMISYHCVFTGNPGTGKTTVARIVADIYKEMGILKKGHLVETDRSGLVADYVGQTATKTNAVIDSALDGVLFIDEAYTLARGGDSDYGAEAVATLLKRMEDERDRLVVILAGYTDEIKEFIDSNPGLQSRFCRYIHFDDYSVEELLDMFRLSLKRTQYKIQQDAYKELARYFFKRVTSREKNFGNGRFVRNTFERLVQYQANRVAVLDDFTDDDLSLITLEDVSKLCA